MWDSLYTDSLVRFYLADNENNPHCIGLPSLALDNSWHYLVGTYNGTTQSLFFDGYLYDSSSWTRTLLNKDQSVYIGKAFSSAAYGDVWFDGALDEVRIWNRTLSADEVYQQYVSNLNKFNQTQWYLYVNQSKNATAGLDSGTYTYQAFASDIAGNGNATEVRNVTIGTETFPCTCGDICVNTTGWWRDNGTFNASTTRIQDAIGNASAGNTVYVYNGSYTENVNVDKRLTLRGEGADVVHVTNSTADSHVFNVTVNYVNISGFNVTGVATGTYKAGIYLGSNVEHCNISDNTASNNGFGIYLNSSSNNSLSNNTANSNYYYGIYLYSSSNYNTLTSNHRVQ